MNMCFGLDKKGVDGYKDGDGNGPVCDDRMGAGIVPELLSELAPGGRRAVRDAFLVCPRVRGERNGCW